MSAELLLLAFGPFGSWAENSSGEVSTAACAQLIDRGVEVHRRVLDTSLSAVRLLLQELLEEPPRAILACGLSAQSAEVRIERCARNLADFRIPDVDGLQPRGEPLVEEAPLQLVTELPVDVLLERMRACGVSAALSDDAGTYVCNALYFSLLYGLGPLTTKALFLHLPPLPRLLLREASQELAPSMTLPEQVRAVVVAAELLLADNL